MDYQKVKKWFAEKENKNKLLLAASFVLVFMVGFGTGGYEREVRRDSTKLQSNYNTNKQQKLPTTLNKEADMSAVQLGGLGQGTTTLPGASQVSGNCVIKGNISSSGKRIYHMQGGAFYKTVKPEQCFNTEQEALAAGFVKSGR